MDESKKYIEMCEKAEEIQKLRPNPIEYTRAVDGLNVVLCDYEGNFWFNRDGEDLTWLPRQDQSQEMIIDDFDDVQDMFCNFNRWIYDEPYKTAEQLWLAFVMGGNYNKTWDGKEWVK